MHMPTFHIHGTFPGQNPAQNFVCHNRHDVDSAQEDSDRFCIPQIAGHSGKACMVEDHDVFATSFTNVDVFMPLSSC